MVMRWETMFYGFYVYNWGEAEIGMKYVVGGGFVICDSAASCCLGLCDISKKGIIALQCFVCGH